MCLSVSTEYRMKWTLELLVHDCNLIDKIVFSVFFPLNCE
jgi:hypothetical protein